MPVWQHVSEDCPSHQERRDKRPRPRPLPEEEGSVRKGRGRERGRGGDQQTKLHLCLHNQSTLLPSQHRHRKTVTIHVRTTISYMCTPFHICTYIRVCTYFSRVLEHTIFSHNCRIFLLLVRMKSQSLTLAHKVKPFTENTPE